MKFKKVVAVVILFLATVLSLASCQDVSMGVEIECDTTPTTISYRLKFNEYTSSNDRYDLYFYQGSNVVSINKGLSVSENTGKFENLNPNTSYKISIISEGLNIAEKNINTLGIQKLSASMVQFDDTKVTYNDGKQIMVPGFTDKGLPKGVTGDVSPKTVSELGTYSITLTLSGVGYETLKITKTLTVVKKVFDTSTIVFKDGYFLFDNEKHSIFIDENTLASGASVRYEGNEKSEVGIHEVVAHITLSGYEDFTVKAKYEISEYENQKIVNFANGRQNASSLNDICSQNNWLKSVTGNFSSYGTKSGICVGTSNNTGELTFEFNHLIKEIKIKFYPWTTGGNDGADIKKCKVTMKGTDARSINQYDQYETYTFDTAVDKIVLKSISGDKRFFVLSIEVVFAD